MKSFDFKTMKKVFLGLVFSLPAFAFAATFRTFVYDIVGIINLLVELLAGAALLAFFWGIAQYIRSAGDEKKLAEGKNIMIWGVLGLFVMVSLWGILAFFYGELGFTNFRPGVYLPQDLPQN